MRKSKATVRFRLRESLRSTVLTRSVLGGSVLGGILLGGTVLLGVPAQAAGVVDVVDIVAGSSSAHVLVGPNRTTPDRTTPDRTTPDRTTGVNVQAGTDTRSDAAPAQPGTNQGGSGNVTSPAAAVGAPATDTGGQAGGSGSGTPSSASDETGVQAGAEASATVGTRTVVVKSADGSKRSAGSSSGRGPVGHVRKTSERPVVELEQGTTQDELKASDRPSVFWWAWLLFAVPAGTACAWLVRRNREHRLDSTGPLYS